MLTKNITKYFKDPLKADQVAAEMQSQDQDWKYVPQHCPKGTGFSFIKIFDEDGYFVGDV